MEKKEGFTTPQQCGSDQSCLSCVNKPTTCWYSSADNVWWERGYGYSNGVCSLETYLDSSFSTEQQCLTKLSSGGEWGEICNVNSDCASGRCAGNQVDNIKRCINPTDLICYYCGSGYVQYTMGTYTQCPEGASTTRPSDASCSICTPDWRKYTTGSCVNNVQNIDWYDNNNCNILTDKPAQTTQSCTINGGSGGGTGDTDSNKYIPWIIGFVAIMFGIKMLRKQK